MKKRLLGLLAATAAASAGFLPGGLDLPKPADRAAHPSSKWRTEVFEPWARRNRERGAAYERAHAAEQERKRRLGGGPTNARSGESGHWAIAVGRRERRAAKQAGKRSKRQRRRMR